MAETKYRIHLGDGIGIETSEASVAEWYAERGCELVGITDESVDVKPSCTIDRAGSAP